MFDTAPSYGTSEEHLGRFLRGLSAETLTTLTIATKCGEHWDSAAAAPYVDHSADALRRSIDRSLERLPRIALLEIHKTTQAVLESADLQKALDHAAACGVQMFGASVTDLDTARAACLAGRFSMVQIPYNRKTTHLEGAFDLARQYRLDVWTNRPFAMGELLHGHDGSRAAADAYRFVLSRRFSGAVLTGTSSAAHLAEDLAAFREATLEPRTGTPYPHAGSSE